MIRPEGLDAEPVGCSLALATRWGRQALAQLYEPMRSMSITVLNALAESSDIGARKFPAAPAL